MEKNLHNIVDIEKYPINDLSSPKIKDLIKKCKEDLDQYSCSTISNFILPKSLKIMREAGCWLVAFGFESGSPDSLKKMQKGATVDDNVRAARLAKEAGLLLYGFFIIGLPWERKEHLEDTYKHIFALDADFIELHMSVPYYGTELYNLTKDNNLLNKSVIGTDYFHASTSGTKFVSSDYLLEFRRKLLLKYHLRPKYIFRKLREAITKPKKILNYARFGVRLIINNLHR